MSGLETADDWSSCVLHSSFADRMIPACCPLSLIGCVLSWRYTLSYSYLFLFCVFFVTDAGLFCCLFDAGSSLFLLLIMHGMISIIIITYFGYILLHVCMCLCASVVSSVSFCTLFGAWT